MTEQTVQTDRPVQINYLILVLTTRCNLRCSYCYHGNPEKPLDMARTTLERAIALAASGTGSLHIQLTGGEPCLVPHLIEAAGRMAQQLQRPYTMAMQTNGTCIDQGIIDLIRRFHLQVGVSLDGSPKMQESLRGKAAETLRGLMQLEAEQIPFRVTTVVSDRNVGQLDRLAWLLAAFRQARGIGLDLLVLKGNAARSSGAPRPSTPAQLIHGVEALMKALTAINQQRETPLRLREWDLVRRLLTFPEQPLRPFCQAAQGTCLAVHPDGRGFPCGQTLGDERFVLDMEATTVFPAFFSERLTEGDNDCTGCPLQHRCPNDCPSRLFYNHPQARFLICDLYQTLARASLQEGTVVEQPAATSTKTPEWRETCLS